ncbi:A disintegrin and metalloproteinase with thrombospondin motifs 12 [Protopterus annectens]|uniref:A disintegrin and metalloproteinase with thrombospondin motifs 12 n=1 Tax=Protopterus annectens TaxID=7888 RepID=UPI001CFAB00C|nr:A disintegrin and metalloproteinase with thrombospondin motifs 12 [Protopterus annectens]
MNCGMEDPESVFSEIELQREHWERKRKRDRKISPRSISKERWVETLVVADAKMVEYHGSDNVESYVFTIMNMVAGLFHDPSIGNAIHIVLVRLILLEGDEKTLKIVHHADHTLASFCKWQKNINPKSDAHPAHHDVAILLTRKDICAGANRACETLGLSHMSGMCQPHRSCNINEDSGLPVAFTIAHELGHSFGILHDGHGNDCEPVGRHHFIMSRQLQYDPSPLLWSWCSKEYITQFLDRGWGFCLDDRPAKRDLQVPFIAPGVLYDSDHQCQLQYGPNSTFCTAVDNVCQILWCSLDGSCRSKLDSAADGTRCGEKKWCLNGDCVTVGKNPDIVNGGWSQWTSWSYCTRTCGVGVQTSERLCNNPQPQFGGKYCTGERKRYRTCNTRPCPVGRFTFRGMQCSEFDTVPHKNELYKWLPVYNTANPCELQCQPADGQFAEKMLDAVIDGTPCFERNNSRDICINGICKSVGCDYEIDSSAIEDQCGVCMGDGSTCQTVKKIFKKPEGLGYVDVGIIPKGARHIKVEEVAEAGNFLAIRSKDPEKYYLNGKFTIQWKGDYKVAGTTFTYERNGNLEYLTAPGPTEEPIWIQLLFQEPNPGIRFEYTIRKVTEAEHEVNNQDYIWKYGTWTECSVTCGAGIKKQMVHCVRKGRGLVNEKLCKAATRPKDKEMKCTQQDCPARWWTGIWQKCSATCGPTGVMKRTVLCTKSVGTDEQVLQVKECQHLPMPKSQVSCNRDVLCPSNWTVSNWSECTVTCGGGVRTRSVTCLKSNERICDLSKKPNGKSLCNLQQCPRRKNVIPPVVKSNKENNIMKVLPKRIIPISRRIPPRHILDTSEKSMSYTMAVTSSSSIAPSATASTNADHFESVNVEQVNLFHNVTEPRTIDTTEQNNDNTSSDMFYNDYNNANDVNIPRYKGTASNNNTPQSVHYTDGANPSKAEDYATTIIAVPVSQSDNDSSTDDRLMSKGATFRYDYITENSEIEPDYSEESFDNDVFFNQTNTYITNMGGRTSEKSLSEDYQSSSTEPSFISRRMPTSSVIQRFSGTRLDAFTAVPRTTQLIKPSPVPPTSRALIRREHSVPWKKMVYDVANSKHNRHQYSSGNQTNVSADDFSKLTKTSALGSTAHWRVGNWSECSTTCGIGAVWRAVECSTRNETDCKDMKMPDPAQRCHLRPCVTWKIEKWSKCSKTCGGGFKTRDVQCVDVRENRPIRPFHCQLLTHKPMTNISCNGQSCLNWTVGPWSECSTSCGGGVKHRTVKCVGNNDYGDESNLCDHEPKPTEAQKCQLQKCINKEDVALQAKSDQELQQMIRDWNTELKAHGMQQSMHTLVVMAANRRKPNKLKSEIERKTVERVNNSKSLRHAVKEKKNLNKKIKARLRSIAASWHKVEGVMHEREK